MVKIALRFGGALYNLSAVSPLIAFAVSGQPLGGSRKFLVLASIFKKKYGTDEAVRRALELLLAGSRTFNDIILNGIAGSLRKDLGIQAEVLNGTLIIKDREKLDGLLDRVYGETVNVLKRLNKPKTKAEAVQAYTSLIDPTEKDVVVIDVDC